MNVCVSDINRQLFSRFMSFRVIDMQNRLNVMRRKKLGENSHLMSNNPQREHAFYRPTINHVITQKMNNFEANERALQPVATWSHTSRDNVIPTRITFFACVCVCIRPKSNLSEESSVTVVQMSALPNSLLNETTHGICNCHTKLGT